MSDHDTIEKIVAEMRAKTSWLSSVASDNVNAWADRLDSLRHVLEAKPLADRLPRESECTAEAAHHFYAQGWNACRDAIANPAPTTSGKPSECADGCPPFQVCDHCQQPSDAVWLMPVATQEPGDSRLLRFAWGRSNLSTGQIAHAYDCIVAAAKECGQTLATHATPAQAGAELPEPAGVLVINGQALRGFTADQMRTYAELARRGGSHTSRYDEEIERAAEVIYNAMPYDGQGKKPAWVPRGNSLKQDEARARARYTAPARVEALRNEAFNLADTVIEHMQCGREQEARAAIMEAFRNVD